MDKNEFFVSPYGENREFVKQVMDRIAALIIRHFAHSCKRSPLPAYGEVGRNFFEFPREANSVESVLSDLEMVFEKSMNHVTPNYMGHMDSMPTLMSIVGEAAVAAINNNMLGVEMSPVFTRMEREVLSDFSTLFGLGSQGGGIMTSGGSLANLQAMIVARNKMLESKDGDVTNAPARPIFFASELAHTSIEKAMMIMGLGKKSLEKIPVDSQGKMLVNNLEQSITQKIKLGSKPICVIATMGTTTTGSMDRIEEIAAVCRKHKLWLHADAIYGGAAILSNKHKHRLAGIELADSIAFNPQKWMLIAKTCSLLMLKKFDEHISYFKIPMPYTSSGEGIYNLGEISIQGSRSAEVLKLWLSLKHLGRKNYEELIDRSYEFTSLFEACIDDLDFLEKYATPETNNILFRVREIDSGTKTVELKQAMLEEYNTYFGLQMVQNKKWLKFMPLNPFINKPLIEQTLRNLKVCFGKIS
ncbi:MAG: aminotransferase class V-fold PLP-dependent enzyme [Cyclobacteriaceae bacterium]